MMERKQLEKNEKNKMVVLNNKSTTPIYDVGSYEEGIKQKSNNDQANISGIPVQDNHVANPQSVIPDEVLEKSVNNGTNSKIPDVLDLNLVDDSNNKQ